MQSLYRRGGVAIFLTFTYRPENLPVYTDVKEGFTFQCFNHYDVLSFLNRVKVKSHKIFGKSSYKYFFTSEYGTDTRRPHYHAIFFLEKHVHPQSFAELCRSQWSYGFMFPKLSSRGYVDNYGKTVDICVRNMAGGARYVSKYITKDMSYFGLPEIQNYLEKPENKIRMKRYLPKHWQSNGFGFCAIEDLDFEKFDKYIEDGIYNPLTQKNIPLPSYIINRLMYRNVSTKGTAYERIGVKGNYLYDRVLTDFGRKYLMHTFFKKIQKCTEKMSETFQKCNHPDNINQLLKNLMINIREPTSFCDLAMFHRVVRNFGKRPLNYAFYMQDLYNRPKFDKLAIYDLYLKNHDTQFIRELKQTPIMSDYSHLSTYFHDYNVLSAYYDYIRCEMAIRMNETIKDREKIIQKYKRRYLSRYDTNLC